MDTGGIGEVSDMGRWREKKDDIFTSIMTLASYQCIRCMGTYQASADSPLVVHVERSRPGVPKISSSLAFPPPFL